MSKIFVARGRCGQVYKISEDSNSLAKKELAPTRLVKIWNWSLYNSAHPASTQVGYNYSYWKRKLAHILSRYFSDNVLISDALAVDVKGFTFKFVEGHHPTKKEKQVTYPVIRKLEDFFDSIGMPTWSFSHRNPFMASNIILQNGSIYIVDYEQSVPMPDKKRRIVYDIVFFEELNTFIKDNRQRILDKLGTELTSSLGEALEETHKCLVQLEIRPRMLMKKILMLLKLELL